MIDISANLEQISDAQAEIEATSTEDMTSSEMLALQQQMNEVNLQIQMTSKMLEMDYNQIKAPIEAIRW
ncbi:MAG: hypothetical protein GF344_13350 [Chitinivibrionales bacterium]|nr:hypothetical protein [Chitinivibrionales bacterium]MBD3357716.1 hypothetical protein [Chitinivibrionales bacterium]